MYDTSSGQSYAASAAADSGAPFYNSAGIYFGNADIGAATLSNTPSTSANPTATATPTLGNAVQQGVSNGAGAVASAPISSGASDTVLAVIAASILIAGAIAFYALKKG